MAMVTFPKTFFFMTSSRCFPTASAHGSATPTRPIFFAFEGVVVVCALIVSSSRNIKLAGIEAIPLMRPVSPHFFAVVAKSMHIFLCNARLQRELHGQLR